MVDTKRAVVIGGSGFLGHRLVALMLGADGSRPGWPRFDHVHVFDQARFEETPELREARESAGIGLSSEVGDIRSREVLVRALSGAHTVFHLASLVDVGLVPNRAIEAINVEGTRNVVRACEEAGVPCLVYTSSEDVVLGETPVARGDETLPYPTRIIHDYVRTKIEGERIVRGADRKGGLRTCSLRPVHIYGPRDPHAIKATLEALGSGSVPFLFGDGSARFDVVYVDNVAHAHLLAAAKLGDPASADQVGGRAYFVGEDNAPNYFDWIRPYAEAKAIRMPKIRLPFRAVAVLARAMELFHRVTGRDVPFHSFHLYVLCQDFYFTNENAERDLGYRPLVTPAEAQARTLAWVRELPLGA